MLPKPQPEQGVDALPLLDWFKFTNEEAKKASRTPTKNTESK
jgi:hypothetical protein